MFEGRGSMGGAVALGAVGAAQVATVTGDPTLLSALRCACGSPDVVLISPGSEPMYTEAGAIMIERGEPIRGTCMACWLPLLGYQQTLFEAAP